MWHCTELLLRALYCSILYTYNNEELCTELCYEYGAIKPGILACLRSLGGQFNGRVNGAIKLRLWGVYRAMKILNGGRLRSNENCQPRASTEQ